MNSERGVLNPPSEPVEYALGDSDADFRTLADSMPQMVWITRPDGWNIFFNERWYEYTGLSRAETEGHGWSKPFHPEDGPRAEAAWQLATSSGGTYSLEARLRRADGVYRWWLVRGVPQRDDAGRIVRWFGTCTDIDDLKQSAAQLQAAEAQLRQVQKMESVGQLAGGIAHDFNNLLQVIIGYAQLAQAKIGVGPGVDEVEEVVGAAERAAAVVRQLLAFSRRQVLNPVALDLNDLVSAVVPMVRRLIGEEIGIGTIAAAGLPMVFADRVQIEQVFLNLAVNARDAMPDGGTLAVETRYVELDAHDFGEVTDVAPGGYVCLSVADTGTGIDVEARDHVFEPFFTTKEVGAGSGLGLSTVYGIVEQSGGHVDFTTETGVGTTFNVYLPAIRSAPTNAPEPEKPSAADVDGHETLLVCEDEDAVREYLEAALSQRGYTVLAVAEAQQALELARDPSRAIDVLITDVVMPRMTGPQLATELSELRPGIPVIFLSGYTAEHLTDRKLPEHHTLLQKPFETAALLKAIRLHLGEREMHEQAAGD